MMKIDIHTHLIPKEVPKFRERFGYYGFISVEHLSSCTARLIYDDGRPFRNVESNCWDATERLKDCDRYGVGVQVVSTVPVMFNYWAKPEHALETSRFLNDHLAEFVSCHPKRFVGLGTLPMQSGELAVRELERCVGELKLAGVQIGTHINGCNLEDPGLFQVFEAAEELGACIFVHPWDMMGQERMKRYWMPWLVGMPAEVSLAICSLIFGGVLERLPKLRIAFAHGGGAFPGTVGRINHGFHARPDLCAVDNQVEPKAYLGRFLVDSLVHDERTLRFILDVFGEDSIALGTDYPFPLGEREPGRGIEQLPGITEAQKEKLLSANALRWLGREAADFA